MRHTLSLCLVLTSASTAAAQAPVGPTPAPPAASPAPHVVSVARDGLGARVMISVFTTDESGAKSAIDAALARMLETEAQLADYVSTSEVSKVNQQAGKGPVQVSPATAALVRRSLQISERTQGAWALTTAGLASLWDFGAAKPKKPDPVRLRERLSRVDDTQVLIDAAKSTVALKNADATLSFAGMLLGEAADRAMAVLVDKGFGNALVFVGGDVRASGRKGQKPWVVGIQDPRAVGYFAVIPLEAQAVATVGDYQRYVEINGERFCNILDPRSGMPARVARSVTVLAKDAATAHALAAAVFVLGTEAGLKIIEGQPDTHAVIIDAQNAVTISTGLKDRLRVVRPPSD